MLLLDFVGQWQEINLSCKNLSSSQGEQGSFLARAISAATPRLRLVSATSEGNIKLFIGSVRCRQADIASP